MKTLISFCILLVSGVCALAQNLDDWRLIKKTYKGPGWTETISYSYSSKWQLKEVRQVQDQKLVQILQNFTFNNNGQTTGYQEINIGVNNSKTLVLVYDKQGRLQQKQVVHFKDGKDDFKTITNFTYSSNQLISLKEILTKKGNATITSNYQLDHKGNVLVITPDINVQETYTSYLNYDNTKNPMLFTGSLIDKDILSPNNPQQVSFSGQVN